jgi:hypothetical protein
MLTAAETRAWIVRIAIWDGALPAVIWLAPVIVQGLIPNLRGPVEIVAVVLPIVAFFIRFHVGRWHISANHCRIELRRFQYVALCFGALVLVLVDAVLILTNIMPKGAVFVTVGDVIVWAILILTYLGAMSIAMYPGKQPCEMFIDRCCGSTIA